MVHYNADTIRVRWVLSS